MPKPKSSVWEYFQTVQKNKNRRVYAKCKFCGKLYYGNPSKLKIHLKNCFKCPTSIKNKFNNKFKQSEARSSRGTTGYFGSGLSGVSESVSKSSKNATSRESTNTDQATLKKISTHSLTPYWDCISAYEQEMLTILLARSVYSSCAPFSIIENDEFKNFINRARPSFQLPTRKTLAGPLLDKEYEKISEITNKKLQRSEFMTLLSDGWTDITGVSIINFILCTPEPVFYKSLSLGTERHSAENIYNVLKTVIEEIGVNKIQVVITDNAPNTMKAAWKLLKNDYPHLITYGCIAHWLNLLAKDLVAQIQTISVTISEAKEIIQFFNNKNIPKQVFLKIQKERIANATTLKVPVDTHWVTYATTLKSLFRNKEFLEAACFDGKIYTIIPLTTKKLILSDTFWENVSKCLNLLGPISESIASLEGDDPKLSYVREHLKILENKISDAATSFSTADSETILHLLKDRISYLDYNIQLTARFLNPKLHYNEDLPYEDFERVLNYLSEMGKKIGFSDIEISALYVEIAQYKLKKEWAKEAIWDSLKELNVSAWWNAFFPHKVLTKLALRFLALPATSASCERNFKTFANIKTKKRNRLLLERTNKLVFVRSNLKYVKEQLKTFDETGIKKSKITKQHEQENDVENLELTMNTDSETIDTETDFDVTELVDNEVSENGDDNQYERQDQEIQEETEVNNEVMAMEDFEELDRRELEVPLEAQESAVAAEGISLISQVVPSSDTKKILQLNDGRKVVILKTLSVRK